jgi:DNA-binding MarR family transcriptional regulator
MTGHAASDDLTLGPNVEFMRTLWQLNHALERSSRRMEAEWGVTAQQRMIIRCVGKYPGMTASQLARHFHLDAGTVSTALGRLERKGLLERRRAPRDRRRLTLGLTADGRAIDREAGTLENAVAKLLETSAEGEVSCTRRVLEMLSELLDLEAGVDRDGPNGAAQHAERTEGSKDAGTRMPTV